MKSALPKAQTARNPIMSPIELEAPAAALNDQEQARLCICISNAERNPQVKMPRVC
jgi:hypothetical protein